MNLFIIENDKVIESVIKSGIYSAGTDIVLCFNYLSYLTMAEQKGEHSFFFSEEFLGRDDYQKLHNKLDRIANHWYKSGGVDKTLYQGISYGDLVRGTFSRKYMLSILVKYGEIIRKVVNKWPSIKKIYSDFSSFHNSIFIYCDDRGKFFNKERLVDIVCRQLGLEYELLKVNVHIPSAFIGFRGKRVDKLKLKINNLLFKIVANAINQWNNRRADESRGDKVYFEPYFNINRIPDQMHDRFVLGSLSIPRPLFKNWWKMLRFQYCCFDDIAYQLSHEDRLYLSSLRYSFLPVDGDKLNDCDFRFCGIDYKELYRPAIETLISDVIPDLIELTGKVKSGLEKFRIRKLVVNDDREEGTQAIIDTCKTSGVKTYWVDHGIQGHAHAQKAFDSKKSDVVICSGSFYVEYYRQQGDDNRLCMALGNPSMDPYPAQMRKTAAWPLKNILFLTFEDNFYARLDRHAYQEKYFAEMFSTFDEMRKLDIKINIKPHPGEREEYLYYLFDFFKVDVRNINVITDIPYSTIIHDMDLQVSNISTCFYEGQAAGVPTIFLEPNFIKDALLPPLNGVHGEEVLRASTGKELLGIIKEGKKDPKYFSRFLDNFLEKYTPLYMGNLDGMASSRIVDYLVS